MTEVVLSFDTEDYAAPDSDEAILELSEILRSQGVKGCFNFVGELASMLAARKRNDIIGSLDFHEIDYHSLRHSHHPTIAEYCDNESWDAGWKRFMDEESRGVNLVKSVFQRDQLWAAVPPGNCIAAEAVYGYPELGIPIYSGSLFKDTGGRGIWFCNALNLENNCYIDDLLLREGINGVRRSLDSWAALDRLIVCCHPNIIIHKMFWDRLNFDGGNLVQWGEWKLPEKRSEGAIRRFFADFRAFIGVLKAKPEFTFLTYEDIWRSAREEKRRTITREKLMDQLRTLDSFFEAGRSRKDSGVLPYSLAELFKAGVNILLGADEHAPEALRGFLREPEGVSKRRVLSRSALVRAAASLKNASEIPEKIAVGGAHIGPRDFLEAAKQVLEGGDPVAVFPKPQMPDISRFHRFEDFRLKGTWVYPRSFEDRWVTKRLRLQSWTIRREGPPEVTRRSGAPDFLRCDSTPSTPDNR